MKNLAHRGYSVKYPENTMEAFIKAYEKGFDGVETDVHLTKDGVLVLIHDEKINRTSTGKGYVKDLTIQELRQYNYCYKSYGHYDIPTLEELLRFIQDKDFIVNIELKTDVIHYQDIEEKVYQLVKRLKVEDKVYYSSFYLPSLLKMREIDPHVYVGYLMEFHYKKKYQELIEHDLKAFHPRYNFLTQEHIKTLKNQNIFIATWTVPNLKEYQRLIDLGVDIIISNEYFK
ncbi:MAG: glycerophosphodiester phosphodiesterase [Longibaculum muris]|uniref:Glycerophosphoryl diester phosphodiesterase n=1 Tax=Longibaculum muris TaxID=1796628 RepID=A0A4R3Z3Z9_9FIRM|nr:glycerophosphodiester phosphodiesterase [Longibaculum muris]KXU47013.1 glycerophosphodiester phosphodiesterase family protein [Candidatus Stoquefichus sp. KLE1796]MBS5370181.1 glycerophosphodiester phosphodiesterase [Coprobacillus cateniformis]MCR1888361.1 glycerophosphodiester phosphodiesterase [Longibaculum muris]MED9812790.1 glycerophosphodiester phosphodiesterase [Longibaculum muris]TCW00585.1 glycerophosphoryl diester phosphodiesterase [Longibaculum muris]